MDHEQNFNKFTNHHICWNGHQLPCHPGIMVIFNDQHYSQSVHPEFQHGHGHFHPRFIIPAYLSHQQENCLAIRTPQFLPTCQVKEEKEYKLEIEPDDEFCEGQNAIFNNENKETPSGQMSNEIKIEDPVGEEISDKVADFIQFVMTNKPQVERLRYLYNETRRPANVASLGEVKGALKTEGIDSDKLVYAQNCMLKGVIKTAYGMDTLFKNVDKLPKEFRNKQLMSDLNSAMKFFGAANFEFSQIRKGSTEHHLSCSDRDHGKSETDYNKRQDVEIGFKTREYRHGKYGSRFHPYEWDSKS